MIISRAWKAEYHFLDKPFFGDVCAQGITIGLSSCSTQWTGTRNVVFTIILLMLSYWWLDQGHEKQNTIFLDKSLFGDVGAYSITIGLSSCNAQCTSTRIVVFTIMLLMPLIVVMVAMWHDEDRAETKTNLRCTSSHNVPANCSLQLLAAHSCGSPVGSVWWNRKRGLQCKFQIEDAQFESH